MIGIVLASLLFATGAALFYFQAKLKSAGGGAPEVAVRVIAPGGRSLYDGKVRVGNATAYSALRAAAEAGHFEVKTRQSDRGFEVYAIAGYVAEGASGWRYGVLRDGRALPGDGEPDRYPLEAGDQLTWRWTDGVAG